MTFLCVFMAIIALASLHSLADAELSETDVVQLSDSNLVLSKHKWREHLKAAKLEEHGFNLTTTFSIETDQSSGERIQKRTVCYMVRDECSKAEIWQAKIEERLPKNFFSSKLSRTFSREIKNRILGRTTKYCDIGLEANFKNSQPKKEAKRLKKRFWPRIRVDIRIRVDMKAKIKY